MHESFKQILIPVDLTINTELAVKRGVELADNGSIIHLLHVNHPKGFSWKLGNYFAQHQAEQLDDAEEKLRQWRWAIEESDKNISVCSWINYGEEVQRAIVKKAGQVAPDLIIIGKSSHHAWFPFLNTVTPSEIVGRTGVPVLTIKPGSFANKIRTVVVPIAAEGTVNKMHAIFTICKKFRVKVHLVTFMNDKNEATDFFPSHLLQTYQLLKSSRNCQVEYSVLHGKNKAEALVAYAEKIGADVLLVNAETETKIGWMNKHISDVLPADSRIQVLAVTPAN